ncbi:hypothetical protein JCM10212_006660 [Sporobolomyces blumeae]
MVGRRCAACGKSVVLLPAQSDQQACNYCFGVDVEVVYCNEKCKRVSSEVHAKTCAGPGNRTIEVAQPRNWNHFCTPACRFEIVTPHLRLRSVEMSDAPRVFKIKNDRLVSSMQLYGRVTTESFCIKAFVEGYCENLVPCHETFTSPGRSRNRYVFAIEPRVLKDGSRSIQPRRHPDAAHDLDGEGYIGNIAIGFGRKGADASPFEQVDVGSPRAGEVFYYPSKEEIAENFEGDLFYELHPNFWRQGVMTEAAKAILSFGFQTLLLPSIVIDPQVFNGPSIALAERSLGMRYRGEKQTMMAGKQLVYALTREEWESGRRKKGKKSKKKKGKGNKAREGDATGQENGDAGAGQANLDEQALDDPDEIPLGYVPDPPEDEPEEGANGANERKKTCRWCQFPSSNATLGCKGCHWAFWCSQACKTADMTFLRGHSRECPGKRNGLVD